MSKIEKNGAQTHVKQWNTKIYKLLFERHYRDLCKFIHRYTKSTEISEDIAQDIFTSIWEKRNTLVIYSNAKSFLYTLARNKAVSHFRKERKKVSIQQKEIFDKLHEKSCPHNDMETKELNLMIEKAIEKLPDKCRCVFCLAWKNNLSYKDIAKELGIKPKTVENHMSQAFYRLRKLLLNYYKKNNM